jgi:hypothetical protein
LQRLNALTPVWQWCSTGARKDHEDIFGVEIKRGEIYFKKQVGPAFGSVEKLSRVSMEKLLYLFVDQMPMVERIADQQIAAQEKEFREIANKLNNRQIGLEP